VSVATVVCVVVSVAPEPPAGVVVGVVVGVVGVDVGVVVPACRTTRALSVTPAGGVAGASVVDVTGCGLGSGAVVVVLAAGEGGVARALPGECAGGAPAAGR
jgi:hypothetical protein